MTTKKRVEVFRAGLLRKQWAFRFVGANGEPVAQSETYKNKADAISAANLVKSGFMRIGLTVEGEDEAGRTVPGRAGEGG